MINFFAYNIIYLILLSLFVQLIQSAADPLDELTINVNIGGSTTDTNTTVLCGVKKEGTQNTSRIVGGNETEINEYPWIVHMRIWRMYPTPEKPWIGWHDLCGGSVIADRWILTAAHCLFEDNMIEYLELALGEHDLTTTAETQITKLVKPDFLIRHPDYDADTFENDIGLLRIPTIDLKTYTPICLPLQGEKYYTGENAWVIGWGYTQYEGTASDKLLEVEVPVLSDNEAKALIIGHGKNITDAQLAVMVMAGEVGKSVCSGDSGGPLSYANPANNGRHEQIGIVSWGYGCATELPAGYTEVSALRSWIDDQISGPGPQDIYTETGYFTLDGGFWGYWGPAQLCRYPAFVTGMELKFEDSCGDCDDTALNGIRLTCSDGRTIHSLFGKWGTRWRGFKSCSSGSYMTRAKIRRQDKQGDGDDTAANGVRFECTDGKEYRPYDGVWGDWGIYKSCPEGSAIMGIQTQVEQPLVDGDDTALNDVSFYCALLLS